MNQQNVYMPPFPPECEPLSEDFAVFVENIEAPVYPCRVSAAPINQVWPGYERPIDQTELASFASFAISGPVRVEVRSLSKRVQSVEIRPTAYGIVPKVFHDTVSFTIDKPCQCTVEVNGFHNALHLFVNPPADCSALAGQPGVTYFGPGVHEVGRMVMHSNETIVIDAGAVVYGGIEARNAENIRVCGYGILDTSRHPRPQLVIAKAKDAQTGGTNTTLLQGEIVNGCMRFSGCTGIDVSGITFRDSNVWTATPTNCEHVRFSNVKLIGMWRYNSDGIDLCNCRHALIENSFLRTFDDGVVLKGIPYNGKNPDGTLVGGEGDVLDCVTRDCVFWCDWGRALEIGVETYCDRLADIVFERCHVIRSAHVAMDFQIGHRAVCENIRFEDITFELDPVNPASVLQSYREQVYENPDPTFVPRLFAAYVFEWTPQIIGERGHIRGVVVKNVRVRGGVAPSLVFGFDAEHPVEDIAFENVTFDGVRAETADDMALECRKFCRNITVR